MNCLVCLLQRISNIFYTNVYEYLFKLKETISYIFASVQLTLNANKSKVALQLSILQQRLRDSRRTQAFDII